MTIEIKKSVTRSAKVALRLSPGEFRIIHEFCTAHNVTFSDFVRQCIRQADQRLIEDDLKSRE
jgi:hypothetical protein